MFVPGTEEMDRMYFGYVDSEMLERLKDAEATGEHASPIQAEGNELRDEDLEFISGGLNYFRPPNGASIAMPY